ncbi:lipocalin family protein [Mucilaginibacter sp. BJC16-A38]|uniref:lipocalin family protein n=1 Tax=Mucilaginibacter phenanthrenivorans TaxID=1234842 RepID=UPI002157150A|nr:lipocalin family protein [Mucilaginibacter phenanthrenivorans]MCR8559277.1 lipocalin family protein [Mucilaginibacter phenanthrenivorans]
MKKPLQHLFLYAVAVCLVTLVYSCSKSTTTPTPKKKTNTELLTSAAWKISAFELKEQDGTWVSVPLTTFQTTIRTTYKADLTYSSTSASNTGGTSTVSGTWKFTNDETTLVTTDSGGTVSSTDITSLTDTEFKEKGHDGSFPYPNASGVITQFYGNRFSWSH